MTDVTNGGGFDVNSMYQDLEDNLPKERGNDGDKVRINKITLSAPDNQGKFIFLSFLDKNRDAITHIKGIRQIKLWNDNADSTVWHRILPKDLYGTLTPEQSTLYDQVVGLHQTLKEDEILDWQDIKISSYSLAYGVPLKQYKSATPNAETPTHVMKPSLFIYPSANTAKALKDAIDLKKLEMGGNISFLQHVFSSAIQDRKFYIISSFAKSTANLGYDVSFGFGMDNEFASIIPKDFTLTQDQLNLFGNPIDDFLGWQNGENGRFNEELFKFMLEEMAKTLAKANGTVVASTTAAPQVEKPVDNNTPIDSMIPKPEVNNATPGFNAPPPPPVG